MVLQPDNSSECMKPGAHNEFCAPGCRQVSSTFKIEVKSTYSNLCTARPLECLCICRNDKQVCLSFTSSIHLPIDLLLINLTGQSWSYLLTKWTELQ